MELQSFAGAVMELKQQTENVATLAMMLEMHMDKKRSEVEERALKEGCQIYGYLEVNRVGGSFHIGTYAKKMRNTFWFIAYIPFEIQICTTQILKAYILAYPKMTQEY